MAAENRALSAADAAPCPPAERNRLTIDSAALQALDLRQFNGGRNPYPGADDSVFATTTTAADGSGRARCAP